MIPKFEGIVVPMPGLCLCLHVEHDGGVHLGVPLADPEVGDRYFGTVRSHCRIQSLWSFGLGLDETKKYVGLDGVTTCG